MKNGGLGVERTSYRAVGRIRAKALGSKKEPSGSGDLENWAAADTEASRRHCRWE